MNDFLNKLTHKDVDELFKAGSIVVFKCAATDSFPLTFVSANVEKVLGYTSDYFYSRENGWIEKIHPTDRERVTNKFEQILKKGGSAINEYRFTKKDGKQIWLRDEIKLQYDEARNAIAILGTSFEITERKKSELQAHREKEIELKNRLSYQHVLAECSNLLVETGDDNIFQK